MERLRRIFRKRTARMAPGQEKDRKKPEEEEQGGHHQAEAAKTKGRWWHCLVGWRRRAPPAATEEQGEEPVRPRWRWPRIQLGRKGPALPETQAQPPRSSSPSPKHSSQDPSPEAQPKATPHVAWEEKPGSPGQELHRPCFKLGSSSSREDSDSSQEAVGLQQHAATTRDTVLPFYKAEEEQREDFTYLEEAALSVILRHLQSTDQTVNEGLTFLRAVPTLCLATMERGEDSLEPPCCKAALVERIVVLIDKLSQCEEEPSTILPYSMAVVCILSKLKPALEPALESRLLYTTLHKTFLMATGHNSQHIQGMQRISVEYLEATLRCLLATAPSLARLQFIGQHLTLWLQVEDERDRATAMKITTSLLCFAVSLLPQFEDSPKVPLVGDLVALLGLCISDPVEEISRQAKEGLSHLYKILLHQKGQDIQEAQELWPISQHQPRRILLYIDLATMGEAFRKILSEDQRRAFAQRALLGIHHITLHVSQAGVVLLYAILGQAGHLTGAEEKEIPVRVLRKLLILKCFHQLPKELQRHSHLESASRIPSSPQQPHPS
ncbi:uncharacterized protein LOC132248624 [Alligator mississippiensis]|uniref:uncharacterized protein LOC132248624 n=2 Tax=Alligator mississippiensis TaxID=8496 RepID=UPI0028774063|nr:uncharacterized protein LOC132248624 [Alligator mississippiensis]XP_059578303.1 uncharacterized protein LOC132248624 [Alligator mississippiensis]